MNCLLFLRLSQVALSWTFLARFPIFYILDIQISVIIADGVEKSSFITEKFKFFGVLLELSINNFDNFVFPIDNFVFIVSICCHKGCNIKLPVKNVLNRKGCCRSNWAMKN